MLAERRRRAAHRRWRSAELERRAYQLERAKRRMLDRLDHRARRGLRVVERLFDGVDAAARHACRLELLHPRDGRTAPERIGDKPIDQLAVRDAVLVLRKTRIGRPLGAPDGLR